MVDVKNAKMVIGVIDVNLNVQVTVQRLTVTYEVACASPARTISGATSAIILVHLITAQVLVNVQNQMVPCVTSAILDGGIISVDLNVQPTALMAARSPQENVMYLNMTLTVQLKLRLKKHTALKSQAQITAMWQRTKLVFRYQVNTGSIKVNFSWL